MSEVNRGVFDTLSDAPWVLRIAAIAGAGLAAIVVAGFLQTVIAGKVTPVSAGASAYLVTIHGALSVAIVRRHSGARWLLALMPALQAAPFVLVAGSADVVGVAIGALIWAIGMGSYLTWSADVRGYFEA
jgi:hypothetical protein